MDARKEKEISREQQIAFLKKINFFNDFDDHELRQFLSVSRWLKVTADTQIIHEQAIERVFYILVKGEVSVFKSSEEENSSVELNRLKTGDCFGEMSLVMDAKRTAGVKTTQPSYLLMVEPDIISTSNVFLQLKFYKRFCEIMANRLIAANRKAAGTSQAEEDQQPQEKGKKAAPAPKTRPTEQENGTARSHSSSFEEKPVDLSSLPSMPSEEDRMDKIELQRLVSSDSVYPISPVVERQIGFFWTTDSGNSRRLAELISLDPVLSARILQVANSSYYRRSSPVLSVPHAMVTLGIDNIETQLNETMAAKQERGFFSGISRLYNSFWHHSVVVGRIAELLQQTIRVHSSVDLYLAGLLHDIGMLALDPLHPDFYAQSLRPDSKVSQRLAMAEMQYIGIDHGTAGQWLGEKMGLPEPYLAIMQYHHEPREAREYKLQVAMIHLADLFAARHGVYFGTTAPETLNPLESFAWMLLQEEHPPFMDVNIVDFVANFENELQKTWSSISELPK
jgi:HD-like signal output (HDOD) protein/CRP-like cAMP-binding protein